MGSKKSHSGIELQQRDREPRGMSEGGCLEHDQQPSAIAQSVARLKSASFRAARERERVPQPLFWSLFAAQLEEIKAHKRTRRLLSDLFGGAGE